MNGIITKGGNLQGAVPPSEAAGRQYEMDMMTDAIQYHENGDDTDPACCTAEAPCKTRVFLTDRIATLTGQPREAVPEIVETPADPKPVSTGSGQISGGKVADPASDAQIRFVKSLNEQHDCSRIGTFPRRTLDAILSDQEVSKGRASRLIEVMQRQPLAGPAEAPTGPAPSDAQLGFLRTLAAENGEDMPEVPTKADASREITRLIQAREDRKASGSAPIRTGSAVTEDGMYRTPDGTIYKVQIAKQGSGRLYAKKLTETDGEWSFVFAGGAIQKLTPADKMTREQAQEFGRLYGVCCRCGADLTDEKSIAEGIGPVCGDRF
jgi:hypothetical protein